MSCDIYLLDLIFYKSLINLSLYKSIVKSWYNIIRSNLYIYIYFIIVFNENLFSYGNHLFFFAWSFQCFALEII